MNPYERNIMTTLRQWRQELTLIQDDILKVDQTYTAFKPSPKHYDNVMEMMKHIAQVREDYEIARRRLVGKLEVHCLRAPFV